MYPSLEEARMFRNMEKKEMTKQKHVSGDIDGSETHKHSHTMMIAHTYIDMWPFAFSVKATHGIFGLKSFFLSNFVAEC